ncbi:urease accessory protein UreF [Cohnella sp. WQ 127256]|uniref:urease accessory protein UreF n=1 Tax=Cohnella sp. WQ 127256 TaxID=2938790 RepID=UPI0021175C99|nr:urease accessory protein UreF [Cohnella sp. WQ 127256]
MISNRFAFVQLLDSALPIGGFSHSFGLEAYVQEGKINDVKQLEAYIVGQLHAGWVRLEGLAIKGVYAALDRDRDDLHSIVRLDQIIHVQRIAKESREGIQKMGKRLLKLAVAMYPELAVTAFERVLVQRGGYCTLPIVFAWICHHLKVDLETTVEGYLYTNITTTVNSALRLMSIGQTEGQVLIRRLQPIAHEQWLMVRDLAPDQLHSFTPAHDIRAMKHETLYSRLFMS